MISGGATASYVYDGDGNCVKAMVNGAPTVYLGHYFEWTGSTATMKWYYYAGGVRVAMRTGTTVTGTVNYLLPDHLGSTATTTDANGNRVTELRYYPYGTARYNPGGQVTTYRFTGQRLDDSAGLYYYGARYYDPALGRFIQPDTIVPEPGNPQALNRYAYVYNKPLRYTDPSGHWIEAAPPATATMYVTS